MDHLVIQSLIQSGKPDPADLNILYYSFLTLNFKKLAKYSLCVIHGFGWDKTVLNNIGFVLVPGGRKTEQACRNPSSQRCLAGLQDVAENPRTNSQIFTRDAHGVIHMKTRLVLASGSEIRARLLKNAGVSFEVYPARADEEMVRASLLAEAARPRDIADSLAELKARKVSEKYPDALVLGCDQILEHNGTLLSKPETPDVARSQLAALQGGAHTLLSAAVIVENGQPTWRHVGKVCIQMRDVSESYINDYVERNWKSIRHSVGCYKLEEEGVRLFSRIDGDYFHVLGMPLLELLAYLTLRGELER